MEDSLPNLKELHLCGNNISLLQNNNAETDTKFVSGFKQLNLLNLEKNLISDWSQVLLLSRLER